MSDSSFPPCPKSNALAEAAIGIDAAELHGSIAACCPRAGARPAPTGWKRWPSKAPDRHPAACSTACAAAPLAQLGDTEYGFDLLLPGEEADLGDRVEALGARCRGFLGGFGLGTATAAQLSDEAREAIEDLARIARAELSFEDDEDDANALEEIIEFVRVAVLLLHSEHGGDSKQSTLH